MKKPNIEEETTWDDFKIIEVNGRQISKGEVSEMIDALIEAYSLMKRGHGKKVTLKEKTDIEGKIEQALEKAGVEL